MKLDELLKFEQTEKFKELGEGKQKLLVSLIGYWKGSLRQEVLEYINNSKSKTLDPYRENSKKYNALKTAVWKARKKFETDIRGLDSFQLILACKEDEISDVYGMLFDNDILVRYIPIRLPRGNKGTTVDRKRFIEILKILKPLSRQSINNRLEGISRDEIELLRSILLNKDHEWHSLAQDALKGVPV